MEAQIITPKRETRGGVYLLDEDQLALYWPCIDEWLNADDHWQYLTTKETLQQQLLDKTMQAWVAGDTKMLRLVVFTQVRDLPTGKVLCVWYAAGFDVEILVSLLEEAFQVFARATGCSRIEVSGRKGWERLLAPLNVNFLCSTWWIPVRNPQEN